jgi:hypothetical protein
MFFQSSPWLVIETCSSQLFFYCNIFLSQYCVQKYLVCISPYDELSFIGFHQGLLIRKIVFPRFRICQSSVRPFRMWKILSSWKQTFTRLTSSTLSHLFRYVVVDYYYCCCCCWLLLLLPQKLLSFQRVSCWSLRCMKIQIQSNLCTTTSRPPSGP